VLTVLLAVLAAATNAVSSVLQRVADRREAGSQDTGVASLTHLLRQPVWLLGIAAVMVAFGLQAAALSTGEVSQVQPLMALELPITLLLASRVFHRHLGRRDWAAVVAMAVGMSVFLFALRPTGGDPGSVGGLEWLLGAGLSAVLVGVLALNAFLFGSARAAASLGIGSGVCFALTAVFMSSALAEGWSWSILARWQTYLVLVAGLAAMLLLQVGLQAGTLVAVQPGVTLADPVVAIVLGMAIFAEHVRGGGWIVLEVAGAGAVGWGVLSISRSAAAAEGGASGEDPDRAGRPDRPPHAPQADD
jgi:drug/metabolite transporter (DMT)-like permease